MRHLCSAALAVLVLAQPAPAQAVDLRLRLKAGETYKQRVLMERDVEQTIGGKPQAMKQSIGMGFKYDVVSVAANGDMHVKMTYTWMRFKNPQLELDSDKPAPNANPMLASLTAIVGQSLEMTLTPGGKVTGIRGVDDMIRKILDKAASDPNQRLLLDQMLKQQYSEEKIKSGIENGLAIYPDKPVAVGEPWVRRAAEDADMPMAMEGTYTIVGRKDGRLEVAVNSKISTPAGAKPQQVGPTRVNHHITGEQVGSMTLDEATGWIVGGVIKQDIADAMTVENPGTPGPQAAPMKVKGTMTFTAD